MIPPLSLKAVFGSQQLCPDGSTAVYEKRSNNPPRETVLVVGRVNSAPLMDTRGRASVHIASGQGLTRSPSERSQHHESTMPEELVDGVVSSTYRAS